MSKNILFRADSSSTIGTGHIMRDLVLAQKYAKAGHNIIFATQDLNGNINTRLTDFCFGANQSRPQRVRSFSSKMRHHIQPWWQPR